MNHCIHEGCNQRIMPNRKWCTKHDGGIYPPLPKARETMTYPNGTKQETIDLIEETIVGAFEAKLPINDAIKQLLALGVTKANIEDYTVFKGYD